ncbi:MAG: Ser/Thr protein kinase RdoA (MazF antagonist) [Cyclobacteriaceae bacterium]
MSLSPSTHPFSTLTPDLVMDAVESVGYRCDARILQLNSYENRVYQIGIDDGQPLIGKFYRPGRWSDEQILEDHAFSQELHDNEISAVPPLVIKDDTTLTEFSGFRFALYPRRGGRAPELDRLDNLEILGRHIARIHAVGGDQPFETRPGISVQDYGHNARTYLIENNFIPLELQPAYNSVTEYVLGELDEIFAATTYMSTRLHGDCHMGNVLWRDDMPHFVDFDDARNGPAIQDLWMLLSGDRETQQQQIIRIMEGYRAFCHFNPAQLRLIEPLRTLRMMYHAAWLARRWDDPAFPRAFPFFNTERYWSEHILELREQWAKLSEPSLQLFD